MKRNEAVKEAADFVIGSDCFGWALEEALENHEMKRLVHDHEGCRHHHADRTSWLKGGTLVENKRKDSNVENDKGKERSQEERKWYVFPSPTPSQGLVTP